MSDKGEKSFGGDENFCSTKIFLSDKEATSYMVLISLKIL